VRKTPSVILLLLFAIGIQPANAASATGSNGATLEVSKVTNISSGDKLTITGSHFDETVGIYLALCKVVPATQLPTPCGGGMDKTGKTGSSIWISSNPPAYGVGLAKPYQPGGRFTEVIKVSPMIGKLDCRNIACAIYVRADHTRTDDRSYDLKIPIKFKK
jgi:ribose/xylose/arabinose/galactoside ABC-type transport system permease subunit